MPTCQSVTRMDISEFRRLGYLQEANRLFFHPLGLALEVIIDKESGVESLGGIWDYRDDPEGMLFSEDCQLNEAAAWQITEERRQKEAVRMDRFGFAVQPIQDKQESANG